MEIEKMLKELDRLFTAYPADGMEAYLKQKMEEAYLARDLETVRILLKELSESCREAEMLGCYEAALQEIERSGEEGRAFAALRPNQPPAANGEGQRPREVFRFQNGMELCLAFYKEYGVSMIRSLFPQYEPYIAAGLVGEGAECFGFDDARSRDWDFGPGFCLWLTDQVYDEIGKALQEAYDRLPTTYMGVTRRISEKAHRRVGVFRIGEFYEMLTGLPDVPETESQWYYMEDYRLAAATNGQVFQDELGEFSRIRRELLHYYPESVLVKKIGRQAALMAQSGQYNYARMYGRGETVTAQIALSEFMQHTMIMVYLLNREYAPFYKWMYRGLKELPILISVREILEILSKMHVGDERIPQTIEIIVALIINEMKKQSLAAGKDFYLEINRDK